MHDIQKPYAVIEFTEYGIKLYLLYWHQALHVLLLIASPRDLLRRNTATINRKKILDLLDKRYILIEQCQQCSVHVLQKEKQQQQQQLGPVI